MAELTEVETLWVETRKWGFNELDIRYGEKKNKGKMKR